VAYEEKRAWIMLVVTLIGGAVYAIVVLGGAGEVPLPEVAYVGAMLWTIGGGIVAAIVFTIAASIGLDKDERRKDQRDREIERFGEMVGNSFLVIGALAAMGMAMAEWDHFWIANAVYLGFMLSGVLSSVTRIFAYRRGFQSW